MNQFLSGTAVDILKVGLSGLAFLLSLMAYYLLRKEQQKEKPKTAMLRAVIIFLVVQLCSLVIVGSATLLEPMTRAASDGHIQHGSAEHLASCREILERVDTVSASANTTAEGLRQTMRQAVTACLPTIRMLDDKQAPQ